MMARCRLQFQVILASSVIVLGGELALGAQKSGFEVKAPASIEVKDGGVDPAGNFAETVEPPTQKIEPRMTLKQGSHGKSRIISTRPAPISPKPVLKLAQSTQKKMTPVVPPKSPNSNSIGGASPDVKPTVPPVTLAEGEPDAVQDITNGLKVEDIIDSEEVYRYASADKPDPFLAPIGQVTAEIAVTEVEAEEIPIVSPLQYYEVKQLVVSGVWESEKGIWKAMIETPDRHGIIAKLQDPIGNSGGRITAIAHDGVSVREYKLKKDGSQEFTDKVIAMAKEEKNLDQVKGGTIILKPGASAPEVRMPDGVVQTKNGLMMQGQDPKNQATGVTGHSVAPRTMQAMPSAMSPQSYAPPQPVGMPRPNDSRVLDVNERALLESMNGNAQRGAPGAPPPGIMLPPGGQP